MNTTELDALFTRESLLGLQGAVAASLLVPNIVCYLFGQKADRYRKWLSLIVALGLAFITAHIAPTQSGMKWVLAFFNGLLIFSSAAGMNQISAAGAGKGQNETSPNDVVPNVIKSANIPRGVGKAGKQEEGAVSVGESSVKPRKFFTNWF
ncbi:MAG: hypothetical protein PHX21_09415 [bacterium]|nr:hypothetical protein [bacterium]